MNTLTPTDDTWPPPDGDAFIRSERFGALIVDLAAELMVRNPSMDFTNAVARVFVWFDERAAEEPGFLARRFDGIRALRAYVRRALLNDARRTERQKRLEEPLGTSEPAQEGREPMGAVDLRHLREAMATLPMEQQRVLMAIVVENRRVKDVAEMLGLHRKKVSRLFAEALDAVRAALGALAKGDGEK